MGKSIFELDNEQLKVIVCSFRNKTEGGLKAENAEIQYVPTLITPKTTHIKGKSLVLDLGGTNYRMAIVNFDKATPTVHPDSGWKRDMSTMKSVGYTREELFEELADMIIGIKCEEEIPIGYCFSYPVESIPGGDAKLLRWTKGVDTKKMVRGFIGKPLLDYLNRRSKIKSTGIKVVNDTIASLFAGLTDNSYNVYIGLIVGTGTNMTTFIPADRIEKLGRPYNAHGLVPVNLESGNFRPPFLTAADDTVDAISGSPGKQRSEKVVSGAYLGDILKTAFPLGEFERKFDTQELTSIMNYPDIYKDVYVQAAQWIYGRSTQLIVVSLTRLIMLLKSHGKDIRKVCLVAEGSLFWSENRKDRNYNILVIKKLRELLRLFGLKDIEVDTRNMNNVNLTRIDIAALSQYIPVTVSIPAIL